MSDTAADDDTTLAQLPDSAHTNIRRINNKPAGPGLSQPYVEDACDVDDEVSQPAAEGAEHTGAQGRATGEGQGEAEPKEDTESHKVRRGVKLI